MEDNSVRALALTAVAPLAWGTTYLVTDAYLPPDRPLLVAMLRALPAGLILLAVRRTLPRGSWWWKSFVLGILNIGLFFPLLFLGAYELPGGVASTLQAVSPQVVMALAWLLIAEHSTPRRLVAGVVGLGGVALLVIEGGSRVSALGVSAGLGSVVVSGLGFVMIKRWSPPVDLLTLVAWQLVWGGLVLVPATLLLEGAPPALTVTNLAGLVWLGSIGTVVAYMCWFTGLRRVSAGAVSLIGLLNPLVGTALGVAFAHETFGPAQAVGATLVLVSVVAGQRLRTGTLRTGTLRGGTLRGGARRSGSGTAPAPTPPPAAPAASACR